MRVSRRLAVVGGKWPAKYCGVWRPCGSTGGRRGRALREGGWEGRAGRLYASRARAGREQAASRARAGWAGVAEHCRSRENQRSGPPLKEAARRWGSGDPGILRSWVTLRKSPTADGKHCLASGEDNQRRLARACRTGDFPPRAGREQGASTEAPVVLPDARPGCRARKDPWKRLRPLR